MFETVFILAAALAYGLVLKWACAKLPGERWQIWAAMPVSKTPDGGWQGLNITYYGLILATSLTMSAALLLVMLGALGIELGNSLLIMAPLLSVAD